MDPCKNLDLKWLTLKQGWMSTMASVMLKFWAANLISTCNGHTVAIMVLTWLLIKEV